MSEISAIEPDIIAILTADKVIREDNGKFGIIGIFSSFTFPGFPAVAPPWFIFVAVSNIRGEHEFSFNLVEKSSTVVVLSVGGKMEIKDPADELPIVIPVSNVTFPKEGIYTLFFSIDGREYAHRKLTTKLVTRQIGG